METWTIKCYGAVNLPLWLWFRRPCIRVLDECHASNILCWDKAGWKQKWLKDGVRLRLKRDGTCAETRFRLSPKRTSPFKSAGASVQSIAGSRGLRSSVSNAGYTTFRGSVRVLATHSICQYTLHFHSLASPCAIRFQTHARKRDWAMQRHAVCGTSRAQVKRASSFRGLNSRL
jgi:hypothetical protein